MKALWWSTGSSGQEPSVYFPVTLASFPGCTGPGNEANFTSYIVSCLHRLLFLVSLASVSTIKLPISPPIHCMIVQTPHFTTRPLHDRPNSPFHQPSIVRLHNVMMDGVVRCLCTVSSSLVTAGKDPGGCGGGMVPHAGHHESHELSAEFRCLPPHPLN